MSPLAIRPVEGLRAGRTVNVPEGVMRPIRPAPLSAEPEFPSGPVVIPSGCTISTKGIGKLVAVTVSSVRISSRCDSRASARNTRLGLDL